MLKILFCADSPNAEKWFKKISQVFAHCEVRQWQPNDTAPADYAIVWKPPAAMLEGRTDLKAIFVLGAGVDAILQLGSALPSGVPLIRLDDAGMAVQMAEYVSYALLRHFRRFDTYELHRNAKQWQCLAPNKKSEFGVGILGLGVLGQRILQAVQHFEFPVHGWSRSEKHIEGVTCYHGQQELSAFLNASRVLVCILPLTSETRHILNRATLEQLPRGAYLINVARGAHVVEQDLLELIQSGHIAGATLDVFQHEPLPADHPFWQEPRIQITPHESALSLFEQSVAQIAEKMQALEQGQTVRGVVDQSKGY
ncbi:2-hydroxyacid dehydrogenase [Undibacterium danionis]|uniref:2-hydroxyacid dehydrogenase n=1 Tax=Undibacterium danionis TaxID=1812100 RepID=A0ABV6IGV2_9BURK